MGWQKAPGYNWRALVEAGIARFKRVVSGGLRSRTDRRRATKAAVAVNVLSRMLKLGWPEYCPASVTADTPMVLLRLQAGPCNAAPQSINGLHQITEAFGCCGR